MAEPAESLLGKALSLHGQGNLEEAARIYRDILTQEPGHAAALANLASIQTRQGRYPEALDCYRQALETGTVTAVLCFNHGNLLQRLGRVGEAARSFEHALRLKPDLYPAHYNLGNLLRDQGQDEDALSHYRAALALKPDFAPARRNLGNLLRRMGQNAEAIEQHRIAVRLEPRQAENHYNLANALADAGNLEEAIQHYGEALRLAPGMAAALLNLGNAQRAMGDETAAEASYRQALSLPDSPVAVYVNLIRLLQTRNRFEEALAILQPGLERFPENVELLRLHGDALYRREDAPGALAAYQKIEALQPGRADTSNALGVAHQALGRLDEAERDWLHCLTIDAGHAEALTNLGTLCRLQKRHEEALAHLRQAVAVRPNDGDGVTSLASTLIEVGAVSEALGLIDAALEVHPVHADLLSMKANGLTQQARIAEAQFLMAQARWLKPGNAVAIGNSLFSSLYGDAMDAEALARFHRQLAGELGQGAKPPVFLPPAQPHGRPLRIGYLSPDFRSHPVGFFIEPVLRNHRTDRFKVTCYALPCAPDVHTERLKSYGHAWRDCTGWNLDRLAAEIRDDCVDILVDLAGHTAGGRMELMARRAAPVQACFLGYPFTTGLETMDYLIAERHLVPPHREGLYTERVVHLKDSFLCYQPRPDTPEVAALPALSSGVVTFGSFNNLPKISSTCIDLWARVLGAVPGSRLALMASGLADEGTRELFRRRFAERGIAAHRIQLLPPVTPVGRYLAEYARIDIALDPIPYNGGTTSCDALWMGVPVVTLAGEGFMSRMGASLLNTVNHPEWIAADEEEYLRIARELAGDLDALATIRAKLRSRMTASGLCDAAAYTEGLEDLYTDMFAATSPWAE